MEPLTCIWTSTGSIGNFKENVMLMDYFHTVNRFVSLISLFSMQAMYIRVKRNKTTYFIQCDPTETVLQMKEKLSNLIDQPANDQQLVLMPAGDVLEDSKSLADQKVNHPSLSSSFFIISYDLLVQLENIISSIFWVISWFWLSCYQLCPYRYRFYSCCQWPVQLSLSGCSKTGNHIIENEFFPLNFSILFLISY